MVKYRNRIDHAPNDGTNMGPKEPNNSVQTFLRYFPGIKRLLEPGCGTGRNTVPIAKAVPGL